MKSLRHQLIAVLSAGACVCLPLGALAVYATAREVLVAQFDATLLAKGQALVSAAEVEDGDFELDFAVQEFAGFGSASGGDYFEITRADGRRVERSASLRAGDTLPPTSGAVRLPDGLPGRALVLPFLPADDDGSGAHYGTLRLVVASRSVTLEKTLGSLAWVLAGVGVALLAAGLLGLNWAMRRGLRPLEKMANEVRDIRVGQSGAYLEVGMLPDELRPVGGKVNDLLDRVRESLARERRFSSHAAHEMRTPLSELRAMTELIGTWPDEATPERAGEMLAIIVEMEELLGKLSLLARAEAGAQAVQREPVDLADTVNAARERFHAEAGARGLIIESAILPGPLVTDPVLWQAIVQNLLGNAVHHAPPGSRVRIQASPGSFAVSNAAPDLEASDVERLFERFWRKRTTRADGRHSGLGLSIVAACAELLGGTCRATLSPEKELTVELNWPGV